MSKTDVEKSVEAINQYFEFKINFYEKQKSYFQEENDIEGATKADEYLDVLKNDWQEIISLVSKKTGYNDFHQLDDAQEETDDFMEMLKDEVMSKKESTSSKGVPQKNKKTANKSYLETLQEQIDERKRQREKEREDLRKERMFIREMKRRENEKNKMTPTQVAVLTGISTAGGVIVGKKFGQWLM